MFESLVRARRTIMRRSGNGSAKGASSRPPRLPGSPVACLRASGSGRTFPGNLFAAFELTIRAGQCLAILGPSGVGKSSLLKLLIGEHPSQNGLSLSWLGARPQRLAYMGQSDVLLPWRPVLSNVTLGDAVRGQRKDIERAQDCLEQVGLERRWHAAYPHQLSGGMRQRVALARCLYERAELVMLDEPLSAVDAALRLELQGLLANKLARTTRVLVTHDPFEAARLGNAIVVLGGAPASVCLQVDDPRTAPRSFDDVLVRQNAERLTRCLLSQPWDKLRAEGGEGGRPHQSAATSSAAQAIPSLPFGGGQR